MNEPNTSIVPSDAAAVTVIETDTRCVGCGYNVRGLTLSATCPECNALVSEAFRIQAWLNTGHMRSRLIAAFCLFTLAGLFAWYFGGGTSQVSGSNVVTLFYFPFTLAGTLGSLMVLLRPGVQDFVLLQGATLPVLPAVVGLTIFILPPARAVMFPAELPVDCRASAQTAIALRITLGITSLIIALLAIVGATGQVWVVLPFGLLVLAVVPAIWIIANDLDAVCRYAGWHRLRSCIRVQRWALVIGSALCGLFILLVALSTIGLNVFDAVKIFGSPETSWHPPISGEFNVEITPQRDPGFATAIAAVSLGLLLLVAFICSLIALPVTLIRIKRRSWA